MYRMFRVMSEYKAEEILNRTEVEGDELYGFYLDKLLCVYAGGYQEIIYILLKR